MERKHIYSVSRSKLKRKRDHSIILRPTETRLKGFKDNVQIPERVVQKLFSSSYIDGLTLTRSTEKEDWRTLFIKNSWIPFFAQETIVPLILHRSSVSYTFICLFTSISNFHGSIFHSITFVLLTTHLYTNGPVYGEITHRSFPGNTSIVSYFLDSWSSSIDIHLKWPLTGIVYF